MVCLQHLKPTGIAHTCPSHKMQPCISRTPFGVPIKMRRRMTMCGGFFLCLSVIDLCACDGQPAEVSVSWRSVVGSNLSLGSWLSSGHSVAMSPTAHSPRNPLLDLAYNWSTGSIFGGPSGGCAHPRSGGSLRISVRATCAQRPSTLSRSSQRSFEGHLLRVGAFFFAFQVCWPDRQLVVFGSGIGALSLSQTRLPIIDGRTFASLSRQTNIEHR